MTVVQMSVPSRVRPAPIASVEFDAAARQLITAAARDGLETAYRPGLVLDVRPRSTAGTVLRVRGRSARSSGTANPDPRRRPRADRRVSPRA